MGESQHYHALIMAGGKGERFWPWSREDRPKQLIPIVGEKTMIEMTVRRLTPLISKHRIWIVTNAFQARMMARLMPSFPKSNFIIEPVGRDSAGAIMLGCAKIERKDPSAVVAVLPADHVIENARGYLKLLKSCFREAAENDVLMTVGIKPTEPSSAYGYIERGARVRGTNAGSFYAVKRFREKPSAEKAAQFVKSGNFYWNAGMFIWSLASIKKAFQRNSPIHARGWEALLKGDGFLKRGFQQLPKISIDYAVMEKSKNIMVGVGVFDWDDVGSWTALFSHFPNDRDGNCVKGEVVSLDTKGSLILGNSKLIATLGVRDLIIIQTKDATLVCHKNSAQHIKQLLKNLPQTVL
jgi:mannose-1-phosphate guanylyltransferase